MTQTLNGGTIATQYTYDLHGNLTSVTDPNGNVTTYAFDDFDRMRRQTSPVTGTTTYDYDAAGNLTATSDANNATATRSYDALGRVTSLIAARGSDAESISWTYDDPTPGRFAIGGLAAMTDPTGSTSYEYDRRGLLRSEAKAILGTTYTTGFGYDADGNRSKMTYPSERVVTYAFDLADRPVSASSGGTTLVSSASYLPFGPITQIVYGNGTTKTMRYDNRYRPLENKLTGPNGVIADYVYAEDNAGNITQIRDAVDPAFNRDFGYDDLNRLVTANTGASLWGAGTYQYDPMGNVRSLALGTSRAATFTYSGTTPKIQTALENGVSRAVSYDAGGNESAVGLMQYSYTPRNLLGGDGATLYAYDGRGVRAITSVPFSVVAFSIDPISAPGGASSTGTVTINAPAPSGGIAVALSSDSLAAAVPASVMISEGSVVASFTILTTPVASTSIATVTATLGTSQQRAALTVTVPTVTALSITPERVTGGYNATGTVTLSGAAPAAGLSVALTSNNAAAIVPSPVVIPADSTTAEFTITTTATAADTPATITASANGSNASATVIVAPAVPASLTLTPGTITGGGSITGTVRLNGVAAGNGSTIGLTSSDPAASLPASVVVAAGSDSATFTIATTPVSAATTVTVTASSGGVTQSATLTINPPVPQSLAVTPGTVTGGNHASATLTLTGAAPAAGLTIALSSSSVSATVPSSLTVAAGATSTTFDVATTPVAAVTPVTITAAANGVAQSATLTIEPPKIAAMTIDPASITGGTSATGTITLNGNAPADGATVALTSSSTAASVPPMVVVPSGSSTTTFTMTTSAVGSQTGVTVTATANSSTASANLTVNPAVPGPLEITPATLTGGANATGAITLNGPAEAGGATAALASDNAAASVPSSTVIAAGATSGSFSIATSAVAAVTVATISSTVHGSTSSGSLTIQPPVVTKVSTSPSAVTGGANATGTVTLNGAAPGGGVSVALASNSAAAVVPASITVAAGQSSASFTITTTAVRTAALATITATANATSAGATLVVNPPALTSIVLDPSSLIGGTSATGTVTLTGPAPAGDSVVALSSDRAEATVPASVTIAAASTSATFTVATTTVTSSVIAHVSATYDGTTRTASLAIDPPPVMLASFAITPSAIVGGNPVTGTITLTAPANAGGALVTVTSDNPGIVDVPPSVVVPEGAASVNFTIGTTTILTDSVATITASYQGVTKSAALTVQAPAGLALIALTIDPPNVAGGTSATAVVTLNGPAPSGGADIPLMSSNPSIASVPSRVKIKGGETTAAFTITTAAVTSPKSATISGSYGGLTQRDTITVIPASAISIVSLTINPSTVTGGTSSTGTVTMSAPAPPGGVLVTTRSRQKHLVSVPPSVIVPGGATTATFTINTYPVNKPDTADIKATYAALTQIATLTVTPNSPPVILSRPFASLRAGSDGQGSLLPKLWHRLTRTRVPLSLSVSSTVVATATPPALRRYSLYTPELNLMAETTTASSIPTIAYEYVWFAGQPLAEIETATGAVHYSFNDHVGTPLLTTNSTGLVDWRIEREPYGSMFVTRTGAGHHQPLSLPGQEDDGSSDRSYNMFRFYRATWGRYKQADPVGIDGAGMISPKAQKFRHFGLREVVGRILGIAAGDTAYSYAIDNAVRNIDPRGLQVVLCEVISQQRKPWGGPWHFPKSNIIHQAPYDCYYDGDCIDGDGETVVIAKDVHYTYTECTSCPDICWYTYDTVSGETKHIKCRDSLWRHLWPFDHDE